MLGRPVQTIDLQRTRDLKLYGSCYLIINQINTARMKHGHNAVKLIEGFTIDSYIPAFERNSGIV